jgi:phosphocarrier protein
MHARAAAEFTRVASKFQSGIFVSRDGLEVNGKSIMGVLMLVASLGTVIAIETKGARAQEAGDALADLVRNRFGEER